MRIGDGSGNFKRYLTDPTPYYSRDFVFELDYGDEYLGGSARTQFNALYGANLPVAAGVKKPTRRIPKLPKYAAVNYSLTPDEIALANQNLVNMSMMADDMGYDISGQMVSHRVLASIFGTEDGADWDISQRLADPATVGEMTPEEIIDTISTKRYGSRDWVEGMMKMNMRGLQTELIAMTAERKILEKELVLAERAVEKQLAAYLSIKNRSQEMLNQAMHEGISVNAMPNIIAAHLEKKGDEFVEVGGFVHDAPADFELAGDMGGLIKQVMELVATNELKGSYYAFNQYGCGKGIWTQPRAKSSAYDFPNRTIRQLLQQGDRRCASDGVYAAGKYQVIPTTLKEVARALNMMDQPYNAENQEKIGIYLLTKKQKGLRDWFAGKGSLEGAKEGIAREWRSVGHPRKCTAKACYPWSGTADQADYKHTIKVWAILEKMDAMMKEGKN